MPATRVATLCRLQQVSAIATGATAAELAFRSLAVFPLWDWLYSATNFFYDLCLMLLVLASVVVRPTDAWYLSKETFKNICYPMAGVAVFVYSLGKLGLGRSSIKSFGELQVLCVVFAAQVIILVGLAVVLGWAVRWIVRHVRW